MIIHELYPQVGVFVSIIPYPSTAFNENTSTSEGDSPRQAQGPLQPRNSK